MKIINLKRAVKGICLFSAIATVVTSCNKDIPVAQPIIYPPANNSATSIGAMLSLDTAHYSFYIAAATKAGMLAQLSDSTKLFTIFLPNNAAFIASGFPSLAAVNAQSPTTLGGIVGYSIIPGRQYTSNLVPTTFPNVQLPTEVFTGSTLPGTPIQFNLTTFPSVRANGFWDNNIPVLQPDIKMQNGVVHLVAGIVAPPSTVLKASIYADANLSYFKAAIARADSGSTGLDKLDSLLGYAVTNMTVLVPNNAAFQTLIFGLAFQSYLAPRPKPYTATDSAIATATGNGAVAAGPAFLSTNNVSTAQIKGILAYHFLATNVGLGFQPNIRAFSVNFATTPTAYTTLVNSSVAVHPGIMAQATFTGPFVSSLKFTGLGTFPSGGAFFSGPAANAVKMDQHAVNGVYHVIDRVLLPQ